MDKYYSLPYLFGAFCADLQTHYQYDASGIVQLDPITNEFVVVCEWDEDNGVSTIARRFSREGTVGDWVIRNGQAFIGETEKSIWTFASTWRNFQRDNYQSNYVNLFDKEHFRMFYALSRREYAFNDSPQLERLLVRLKAIVNFALLCERSDDPMSLGVQELLIDQYTKQRQVPTLQQWQHIYLSSLLQITQGKVDGPGGAASFAGLKPSTFRYRLQKVGLVPSPSERTGD